MLSNTTFKIARADAKGKALLNKAKIITGTKQIKVFMTIRTNETRPLKTDKRGINQPKKYKIDA